MTSTLLIRPARHDEQRTVWRLAALDSSPAPRGEVLFAVRGDRAVAALSVTDGRVVADPFVATDAAVELLREHADGLRQSRAAAAVRQGRSRRTRRGGHARRLRFT